MSMKRNIITRSESGNIIILDNVAYIWMSEPDLVELFGVIAPTLRAAQVRKILFERLFLRKEKTSIFFSLGVNSMETPKYQA